MSAKEAKTRNYRYKVAHTFEPFGGLVTDTYEFVITIPARSSLEASQRAETMGKTIGMTLTGPLSY